MYTMISIFLVLFCVLGVFDGWYFHLHKFKLHLIPAARKEHLIHTLRAFLFVPFSLLLFVFNSAGWLLYTALAVVVTDLVLELFDILEERKSRLPLGGTPAEETAIHIFASSFKFTAIVILCLTKPPEAYSLNSEILLAAELPLHLVVIGLAFAVGCLIGGVHSLILTGYHRDLRQRTKVMGACQNRRRVCPIRVSLILLLVPSIWAAANYVCGSC